MRTDVKIGIAVGMVLCATAVIWIVLAGGKGPEQPVQQGPTKQANRQVVDPNAAPGPPETVHLIDPAVIPEGSTAPLPAVARPGASETTTPGPAEIVPVVAPEDAGTEVVTIVPHLPEDANSGPAARNTDPVIIEPVAVGPPVHEGVVDSGSEIIPVSVSPGGVADRARGRERADAAAGDPYVVQEGDSLWTIAEKAYGNGKYFAHIHKANPSIRPSQLRPGQKLTIPPLPKTEVAAEGATTPAGRHGAVVVGAAGEKVYVVKKGDMLWKIAEDPEVYGKGEYWHMIQKANPGVNPRALRPGQRLKIPPLAGVGAEPRTARRAPVVGKAPTETEPGTHVVAAGDAGGFSGIAKKAYGSAALWPAIQKANPDVDTRRLRAGQELILPSLNQARRIAGAGSRPSRTTTRRPSATRTDSAPPSDPAPSSSGTEFD